MSPFVCGRQKTKKRTRTPLGQKNGEVCNVGNVSSAFFSQPPPFLLLGDLSTDAKDTSSHARVVHTVKAITMADEHKVRARARASERLTAAAAFLPPTITIYERHPVVSPPPVVFSLGKIFWHCAPPSRWTPSRV